MPAHVDLISTAIAPIAALGGVILGGGLASQREKRQWMREKRLDAYKALNSAARGMLWRGGEIGIGSENLTTEEQVNRVRSAMFELREAAAFVELIGDEAVARKAGALRTYFGHELYDYLTTLATRQDSDHRSVRTAQRLLKDYQEMTRGRL